MSSQNGATTLDSDTLDTAMDYDEPTGDMSLEFHPKREVAHNANDLWDPPTTTDIATSLAHRSGWEASHDADDLWHPYTPTNMAQTFSDATPHEVHRLQVAIVDMQKQWSCTILEGLPVELRRTTVFTLALAERLRMLARRTRGERDYAHGVLLQCVERRLQSQAEPGPLVVPHTHDMPEIERDAQKQERKMAIRAAHERVHQRDSALTLEDVRAAWAIVRERDKSAMVVRSDNAPSEGEARAVKFDTLKARLAALGGDVESLGAFCAMSKKRLKRLRTSARAQEQRKQPKASRDWLSTLPRGSNTADELVRVELGHDEHAQIIDPTPGFNFATIGVNPNPPDQMQAESHSLRLVERGNAGSNSNHASKQAEHYARRANKRRERSRNNELTMQRSNGIPNLNSNETTNSLDVLPREGSHADVYCKRFEPPQREPTAKQIRRNENAVLQVKDSLQFLRVDEALGWRSTKRRKARVLRLPVERTDLAALSSLQETHDRTRLERLSGQLGELDLVRLGQKPLGFADIENVPRDAGEADMMDDDEDDDC